MGTGSHAQLVFLLLLLVVAIFAAIAQRIRVPYPIVLVVAGLVLGFLPHVPAIELRPDVIFYVILPLLLYWAAWHTSWREFIGNITSITVLAVGLVAFTVFGVAIAAPMFLAGFDWRSGFILGAVIAPTDAIAATAIARRLGLQKRLVDIIEGESLVNDATGLLALELGTATLLLGTLPSLMDGVLRFIYVCVVGVAVGIAVGWFDHQLERVLIDDPAIVITISVLVPFAAYLAADVVNASGVLSVVACGLYGSRKGDETRSARVRLDAAAVWNALAFMLNGLVFLLIGLQIRPILISLGNQSAGELVVDILVFSLLVIALRLIWVYPAMTLGRLLANRFLHRAEPPLSNRSTFVIGWASMRGVIALAAAMSLPHVLPDGRPFTQRTMIIVLTFGAIFFSLVLKGLTFPAVIRGLGLAGTAEPEVEELEARRMVIDAAMRHLDARHEAGEVLDEHHDDLRFHYAARLGAVNGAAGDEHGSAIEHALRFTELSRELLNVQRQTAIRMRNDGRISDDVLRELLAETDFAETRLNLDLKRLNARAGQQP